MRSANATAQSRSRSWNQSVRRRRSKQAYGARRGSTLRRCLANFFLVAPFHQPVLDVPELKIELVVHVLYIVCLFDDRGDVAFQPVGSAYHAARFHRLVLLVELALLTLQFFHLL